MTIQGNTLFLGDSMSVALAPAVSVNGTKTTIAKGSQTSTWLKGQVTAKSFDGVQNVFLLIGANDIGWMNPADTLANIAAIKVMAPNVPNFYVMTLPPFKGWANYASNYAAINARRLQVNAGIHSAYDPMVIPLDNLLADSTDPEKLKASADSGDHLHPLPSATAKAIETTVNPQVVPSANVPSANAPTSPAPSLNQKPTVSKQTTAVTANSNSGVLLLALGALGAAIYVRSRR